MKNLEIYSYETAKITILWNGIPQPLGLFKTAISAKELIEKNHFGAPAELNKYQLQTPSGIINVFNN